MDKTTLRSTDEWDALKRTKKAEAKRVYPWFDRIDFESGEWGEKNSDERPARYPCIVVMQGRDYQDELYVWHYIFVYPDDFGQTA